ncbi:MAG TPA: branched-chain amino acid ABC transporter permease [Beijerinckiaceae bacterium]|nr:branched-chain amino acid ABC transporter permease [Methylobacteriaceae bacterium]HPG03803.1 branched-chain amino acid ABC transporter permease [Rhodoblastus sp.]HRY03669.1 branched-chain amino acid ABC transporter permease [Beijerinckiaceae bacterium]
MSETARTFLAFALFALVLAFAPLVFTSGLALTMMSLMGVMIIFALSYNVLLGQTGLLSFGHAVYYGLGGFCAAHAMNYVARNKFGVPLPAIPLVGAAAGLFFGAIFGAVSTRRAGTVFSMISLGIGELVAALAGIQRSFFGGEDGIATNRVKLSPFLGYKFGPQIQVYYLIAAWCLICVVLMYALTRTPFGRMSNAVRDNPERAEFVGYSTQRIRFQAFVLSAMFAGVAGSLAAINFELMNSQAIGAGASGQVLLMTFVGGIGHFFGPIIGAVLITFLQISLSDITKAWMLYFGLLFILVVMFAPGGIAGWLSLHQPLLRGGRIFKLVPSYLMAAVPLAALVLGGIALIEMAHHMLVEAGSEGSRMQLFGIAFDGASPIAWLVALAVFAGGALGLKLVWPRIDDAWAAAQAEGKKA